MDTNMKKRLSLSLYLNYFVHGIGLIILAQNMQTLGHLWQSPLATVSYVISGVGIGRLLAYLLLGSLADRYGRKSFVFLGMGSYLLFFVGILLAPNIQVAYLLAILAGVANSALDSGTYPTFAELGDRSSPANVLLKAFISLGEFVLPLCVALLENQNWWFGWSFILAALVLSFNFFLLLPLEFPPMNRPQKSVLSKKTANSFRKKLAFVALTLYGYTSMALMILYIQWITLYATQELQMNNVAAHFLLSLYSIGSITGVLLIFWLLRSGFSELTLLLGLNCGSLVALLLLCFIHVSWLAEIASLLFGLTAASGVMQIGLNIFLRLAPERKGLTTGIFFTLGSLASFSIPVITGWLSQQGVAAALEFNLIISLCGLLLALSIRLALGKPHSLTTVRSKISLLDRLIVRLLAQRFKAVDQVAAFKRTHELPVLDSNRENIVLENIARHCPDQQLEPYLQDIYSNIMANSRKYQEKKNKKEN